MSVSFEQEHAAKWLAHNNGLLLATPGAGKTRTTLHMLAQTDERALIIAPASVARRTWQDEAAKVYGGFNTRIIQYAGSPASRAVLMQNVGSARDIHIVCSYELASECTARYADLFDVVVFDEVTRLRNPKSKRHQAIRNNVRCIDHKIGLTGTPAPNHYHQLYGQLQITAGLPMLYEKWLSSYFEARKVNTPYGPKTRYVDGPYSGQAVDDWLTPRSYRMPAGHVGDCRTIDHWVDVPKAAQVAVTMDNRIRAHQLAQGQVYVNPTKNPDGTDTELYKKVHFAKSRKLENLLEELQGEPALIFYQFRHDIDSIKLAADAVELSRIEVPSNPTQLSKLLPDWDEKRINALVVHPASAGHGLNLQQGSRTVIWYGLPEDAELYEQGMKRIDRQGQTQAVMNHRIVAECEIDRLLVEMLATKIKKSAVLLVDGKPQEGYELKNATLNDLLSEREVNSE